ncbi:MAG TPA: EAL domain-containing protein [Povalibacter sp.]|nr:EAL domain-containing protein [Povalibacter sp.]
MTTRVALGFAAIAVAILAANLVTQHSTRTARDRMRQLVVEHEPVTRATESLAGAISVYERVVIDRAERGTGSLKTVDVAAQRVADAAAVYADVTQRNAGDTGVLQQFTSELDAFRAAGGELVHTSTAQRIRAQSYWQQFRELEQLLNAPQDSAGRFAGGVFASESLLELSRLLGVMRERVSAAMEARALDDLQPIVASEYAFRAALRRHEASLVRSHGEEWVEDLDIRTRDLLHARRGVFDMNADLQQRSRVFRDQGAALWSKVLTQLVGPARIALANADGLAAQAAAKADRELTLGSIIVLLLLLVISVTTVASVRRPIRRLTEATRRLAAGAINTRVPRGGFSEMDTLAGAFNHMAAQLQRAETEVRTHQLQLESRVAERTLELQHLANHDPLTQLPNRRKLFDHLHLAIVRARTAGTRVALLFIDLDNFKTINDSLGHEFGDRVLQAVGERLRQSSIFAGSFSARLGGDEFTVVCENVDNVERLCAVVLEVFQGSLSVRGRDLRLSVSVGASVFPDHGDDGPALLRAADVALFHAKEHGRNRSSLFAPELLQVASSRFRTEQALRRAIERGEFALLYQPQVCLETQTTPTVEALLRWHQPDGQVLAPGDFLHVAEQSGLIMEISDWVLRTAITAAAYWHFGSWPGARVAVNVSAHQLLATDFVPRLKSLLEQHALPVRSLEIELTENVLQTGAATIAVLDQLRQLGVSIAIDDFGIGYSSLTSLERLPLTRVKIDRSLIASIDTGTRSPAIVRSIIGLSHSLGLQVTAEGVERPSQLRQLLHDRGVHVQGYLISQPLTAAAIPAFVESSQRHLGRLLDALPEPVSDIESSGSVRALRTVAWRKP